MQTQIFFTTVSCRFSLTRLMKFAFVLGAISVAMASTAAAATKTIYRLTDALDGNTPESALARDAAGNLYGTSVAGGNPACTYGCGAAFELSPVAGGGWKHSILHRFTGGADGDGIFAGLTLDSSGNLYGTAAQGGKYGHGNVFEISPLSGGGWKFSVIYVFRGEEDGASPTQGVIIDSAGNLYGVSSTTVFELSPTPEGGWIHSVLHVFPQSASLLGLTLDASGNLFGATAYGGTFNGNCELGCGTVYELSLVSGVWKQTTLYSFTGNADGATPLGGVTLDSSGNVYGVAALGGNLDACPGGCGTVYELTPSGSTWNETVLLTFNYTNGEQPHGRLIFDSAGNLYGTTEFDNQGNCGCGVVYKLSPVSGEGWTQTLLQVFEGGSGGKFPQAGLVPDGSGNFYGTTSGGGNKTESGTVYEITP